MALLSIGVTPLLLLRTDKSTERGLILASPTRKQTSGEDVGLFGAVLELFLVMAFLPLQFPPLIFLGIITMPVGLIGVVIGLICMCVGFHIKGILIRIVATVWTLVSNPIKSLSAIPRNWRTSAFKMDILVPVEILPGVRTRMRELARDRRGGLPRQWSELAMYDPYGWVFKRSHDTRPSATTVNSEDSDAKYSTEMERYSKITRVVYPMLAFCFWIPFAIAMALFYGCYLIPAALYRYSLKSTAVIYHPLAYLIETSFFTDPRELLENICEVKLSKMQRAIALGTLVAFGAKIVVYSAWRSLPDRWADIPFFDFVNAVIVPDSIPRWQVAGVVNGVLAFVIYFMADKQLRSNPDSATSIRLIQFVRSLLSVYTIVCLVLILIQHRDSIQLPPLGKEWLP